ncbi:hypothetical protein EJ05DRAFT_51204 [Pseudovirgaria hyperparasitica]|uniref:Secreted protein n=1 Tax=Pseudovirgaria hyperparasitica TaxID=470096 RepID=A0A6A6W631_9PEZI|nr:uncharacterized protein EJ05DRAFT_51204 [Pseudovirgaria hyperparasitica]KAF2757007.1 hypothetical protein EJ05DRAFT_51204 [Pseudovirgaria hyperparasitica]
MGGCIVCVCVCVCVCVLRCVYTSTVLESMGMQCILAGRTDSGMRLHATYISSPRRNRFTRHYVPSSFLFSLSSKSSNLCLG